MTARLAYLWLESIRPSFATRTEETGPLDAWLEFAETLEANCPVSGEMCHAKGLSAQQHLLSVGELVRPSVDVDSVFAIGSDQPLDIATEIVEGLFRGLGVWVGNVDEDTFVAKSDGSRAASNGDSAKTGLLSDCHCWNGRRLAAHKRLTKSNHAGDDLTNNEMSIARIFGRRRQSRKGRHES